jgi:hypothetical protein
MNPVVQQIAREYKAGLRDLYGDDLAALVLYGSYARGEQHAESDVDFAVVLRNSDIRPSTEISKISPLSSQLWLKHGLVISTLPVSLHKMKTSMQGVYQNIRREGVSV